MYRCVCVYATQYTYTPQRLTLLTRGALRLLSFVVKIDCYKQKIQHNSLLNVHDMHTHKISPPPHLHNVHNHKLTPCKTSIQFPSGYDKPVFSPPTLNHFTHMKRKQLHVCTDWRLNRWEYTRQKRFQPSLNVQQHNLNTITKQKTYTEAI